MMNYHIELDHDLTYAVYMIGENQPIQTCLTLKQAIDFVISRA